MHETEAREGDWWTRTNGRRMPRAASTYASRSVDGCLAHSFENSAHFW